MPTVEDAPRTRFARYLGKTIPRAGIKTIVATENSIADKWSKLQRDGAFKFDCQVGNAAARIQTMRRGDCAGRAGFDAALARSAAIWHRLIRRQFERRQNFREKKPCPESFVDQHRALAVPADAGLRRVIAFQNRPGIDITFLLPADSRRNSSILSSFFSIRS